MNRSSIFSLLLVIGIVVVVVKIYLVWRARPWQIPRPEQQGHTKIASGEAEPKKQASALPVQWVMSTKNIIDNNLFDPERGTGKKKENEALARATQKIRSLVLIGTVIIGENRYAILQDSSTSSPSDAKSMKTMPVRLRLSLGDTFESFKLAQIEDRKVSFSNGSVNVEISLDFFRRVDGTRSTVGASRPISQNVFGPRRATLPPPPHPK